MVETTTKSAKTIWFAFKTKRGSEKRMVDYLKEHASVADVTVFFEKSKSSDQTKKGKVLWPGMIFVKTELADGGIDKDLHDFILDSSDFVRFYTHGRNYRSNPVLMSEKLIDKMIKKVQSEEKPTTGKFTPDQIDFKTNDIVTVLDGVFRGYEGEVTEINFQTGIITLNTEFFGRITPIQVGFSECKKVV